MKNLYLTISTNENGKKCAFPLKVGFSTNLAHFRDEYPHAEIIQAAATAKEARETAERWNAVYKANGVYMFDTPAF